MYLVTALPSAGSITEVLQEPTASSQSEKRIEPKRLQLAKDPANQPKMMQSIESSPRSAGEIEFRLVVSKSGSVSEVLKISGPCQINSSFSEFARSLQFKPSHPDDHGPWMTDFVISFKQMPTTEGTHSRSTMTAMTYIIRNTTDKK
jgi:hypothetical protein